MLHWSEVLSTQASSLPVFLSWVSNLHFHLTLSCLLLLPFPFYSSQDAPPVNFLHVLPWGLLLGGFELAFHHNRTEVEPGSGWILPFPLRQPLPSGARWAPAGPALHGWFGNGECSLRPGLWCLYRLFFAVSPLTPAQWAQENNLLVSCPLPLSFSSSLWVSTFDSFPPILISFTSPSKN